MEWQPISTAPKDGTSPVLVADGSFVTVARWIDDYSDSDKGWYEVNNDPTDAWGGPLDWVTHWMPLPPPPYATKADSDGDDGA